VDETRAPQERASDYVRRLARAKAKAAWERDGEIVLGADTVVVLDEQLLDEGDSDERVLDEQASGNAVSHQSVLHGNASNERVLEKPSDAADATRMLRALSARQHTVITGICLRHAGGEIVDHESTRVRFVALDDREVDEYVASGEPMDKAGAYAIQGLASKFIDRIEGCYFNVMGLPLALVYRHLKSLGSRP
jgi:septum formation protein